MKPLNLFIKTCSFLLLIFLAFSCTKEDPIELNHFNSKLKKDNNKPVLVSVPFKADFSVWDKSDYTDPSCGGYPVFVASMEGGGNTSHLGKMTVSMSFCVDITTGYYYDTVGTFVAANGDKLFIEIPEGQIIPNDEDNSSYYQTKFNDKMYFIGGTGRFEGASGEAMSNAYVHDGLDEWRTDFFSEGTLILIKGKR